MSISNRQKPKPPQGPQLELQLQQHTDLMPMASQAENVRSCVVTEPVWLDACESSWFPHKSGSAAAFTCSSLE